MVAPVQIPKLRPLYFANSAPVSAISVLRFLPSSSTQPLYFLSHPCKPSSFMQLRALLRNGAPLSLLFFNSFRPLSIATEVYPSVIPDDRPSGFQRVNAFVYKSLAPLCPHFAPFSASVSFVFNRLQPLFQKHPGWGTRPSLQHGKFFPSAAALFARVKR
jgi:hypothetical protein